MANTNTYNESLSWTGNVMENIGGPLYGFYQSTEFPKEEIAAKLTPNVLWDKRKQTSTHEHYLDVYEGIDNYLHGPVGELILVQERCRTLEATTNKYTGEAYNDFTIRYKRDGHGEGQVKSELFKLVDTIDKHPETFVLSYGVLGDPSPKKGVDPIPTKNSKFKRYVMVDLHAFVNEIKAGNIVLDDPDQRGKRNSQSYVDKDGKLHLGWNNNNDADQFEGKYKKGTVSSSFVAVDVGQLQIYFPNLIIDQHGFKVPSFEEEFNRQYDAGAFDDLSANLPDDAKAFIEAGIEVLGRSELTLDEKGRMWAEKFGPWKAVLPGHIRNMYRLQYELDMPLDIMHLNDFPEEKLHALDIRIAEARSGKISWEQLKEGLVDLDFVLDDSAYPAFQTDKQQILALTAQNRAAHPELPFRQTILEKAIEEGEKRRRENPDFYIKSEEEIAHNEARIQHDIDKLLSMAEFDDLPTDKQNFILEYRPFLMPDDGEELYNPPIYSVADRVRDQKALHNTQWEEKNAVNKNFGQNILF